MSSQSGSPSRATIWAWKWKAPLSYEVFGTACLTLQCHLPENLCLATVAGETQISHFLGFTWIYLKCLRGYTWNTYTVQFVAVNRVLRSLDCYSPFTFLLVYWLLVWVAHLFGIVCLKMCVSFVDVTLWYQTRHCTSCMSPHATYSYYTFSNAVTFWCS